jgi:K+-sensing histidine kinase KdpD
MPAERWLPAEIARSWRPPTRLAGVANDEAASVSRLRRWTSATVTSIALIGAISAVIEVLDDHAPVLALSVLYLLAVVPVAVLWGVVFAAAVSVLSVLSFGYLFVSPRQQLNLYESGDWIALVVFVLTAVVVSELAARLHRAAQASARLAEEQGALHRVATLVARVTSQEQLDALISAEVGTLLAADLALMSHYQDDGSTQVMGQWARSAPLPATGCSAAVGRVIELVGQTSAPQRVESPPPGTAAGDAVACSAVGAPITVEGRLWGAMIVASGLHALPPNTGARLADFTALVAIAIANSKNRADLAASRERVVVAADQTRRRIERDLHDGAQQQLVALAIEVWPGASTRRFSCKVVSSPRSGRSHAAAPFRWNWSWRWPRGWPNRSRLRPISPWPRR